MRPSMDSAMPLRSAATPEGSKPLPRSLTNSETLPGSTSANRETTSAPDHLAALTAASRAAASRASRLSVSGASPTTTVSTLTPWSASTSDWMQRTAAATVPSPSANDPGGSPSNNHDRSSRSWARASWATFWGSSAWRWIMARVCRTESCTLEARSARSSARRRAWRSNTSSRATLSHHGPKITTIDASIRATPPSGRSRELW